MSTRLKKLGIIGIKALLTFAFAAAGLAKLAGAEMMTDMFDAIGSGQWFRFVTGVVEITGAMLIWVNGYQFIGAGLLLCTMIGALLTHILVLGVSSAAPAIFLGVLAAFVAFAYRQQNPIAAAQS